MSIRSVVRPSRPTARETRTSSLLNLVERSMKSLKARATSLPVPWRRVERRTSVWPAVAARRASSSSARSRSVPVGFPAVPSSVCDGPLCCPLAGVTSDSDSWARTAYSSRHRDGRAGRSRGAGQLHETSPGISCQPFAGCCTRPLPGRGRFPGRSGVVLHRGDRDFFGGGLRMAGTGYSAVWITRLQPALRLDIRIPECGKAGSPDPVSTRIRRISRRFRPCPAPSGPVPSASGSSTCR